MQIRPVTGTPHKRFRFMRRLMKALLRWTFIAIGALATASVLFAQLYRVNESICDPSLFAIGVGYVNDAYCALIGAARETLLGATDTLPSLQQGRTSVLPNGTPCMTSRS
jgi:hypothetical protein